jgi:hypothetical protein
VAVFDARDALLAAMGAAKAQKVRIVTAFSPAYDPEILAAADVPRSAVSVWTVAGGVLGAIGGLALTIWTVRQWPVLIVGGKPLVALPPFLIVAFELTILIAVCATFIGFFVGGRAIRRIARAAYEPSMSEARFGLLVACPSAHVPFVGELMTLSGAATWRVV